MEVHSKHRAPTPAKCMVGDTEFPYITVHQGNTGFWFAVMYWWNPEGFMEPWDTHKERRLTQAVAKADAYAWARDEGLEVRL